MICFSPVNSDAIGALTDLERSATPHPWTAQNLLDSYKSSADCYRIERLGEIIGYCVVQPVLDEAELLNIVIFKSFQSQGYGSKVVRKLKQELAASGIKILYLEVRVSNLIAKNLYEKSGFEVVDIRKNYYRAGNQAIEDALVMCCSLQI